ncbi:MAG: hypothetical protein OEZ01_13360 [Candidatus Heimdallarchaeota archaeon]|nr:hypothetical protein [Candidatus Heimdallarchaeota archaeon]MDH5646995.1 hypothetical protein [Candidatus Heimdallarchaeota archaeon]
MKLKNFLSIVIIILMFFTNSSAQSLKLDRYIGMELTYANTTKTYYQNPYSQSYVITAEHEEEKQYNFLQSKSIANQSWISGTMHRESEQDLYTSDLEYNSYYVQTVELHSEEITSFNWSLANDYWNNISIAGLPFVNYRPSDSIFNKVALEDGSTTYTPYLSYFSTIVSQHTLKLLDNIHENMKYKIEQIEEVELDLEFETILNDYRLEYLVKGSIPDYYYFTMDENSVNTVDDYNLLEIEGKSVLEFHKDGYLKENSMIWKLIFNGTTFFDYMQVTELEGDIDPVVIYIFTTIFLFVAFLYYLFKRKYKALN